MNILSTKKKLSMIIVSKDKFKSKGLTIEWQEKECLIEEIKKILGPISDQFSKNKTRIQVFEFNISGKKTNYFSISIGSDVDTIYNTLIKSE